MRIIYLITLISVLISCQNSNENSESQSLSTLLEGAESIVGKPSYLNSPYVTAGDRLYMVGHQNGKFPDMGWHVTGEMGGIWDHPIKLMDGFTINIATNGSSYCLDDAIVFKNYPFANEHLFKIDEVGVNVQRVQFVPDGMEAVTLDYVISNDSDESKQITLTFNGMIDLRPVWLGERTNMEDGKDELTWDETRGSWIGKDENNDWYVQFGSTIPSAGHQTSVTSCNFERKGMGSDASISYNIELQPNSKKVVPFTIAGSYKSKEEVQSTYAKVSEQRSQLLKSKLDRYAQIAERSKLTIPDKELEQAFRWIKYNTDWLIRDVPETGRGICAGIPDYPWWFGVDSEYTLQGALAIGQTDLVYSTIELLNKLSEETNGNGRIIHEASTNGVVFNPGNINETPQFATLVWKVYQWTGDDEFLAKYYPVVKEGLSWLMTTRDEDNNKLPDGFGMMEIHGMDSEMIDVAVYTQQAFADAAKMARVIGEEDQATNYQETADLLKQKINTEFWVEGAKSYADFIGTKEQALHLLDAAIVRADTLNKPWAVEELEASRKDIEKLPVGTKQGFVMHHNWVVNTPMEMGIADEDKALAALDVGKQFVNPFGVFVTGIDRDESAGKDESSFGEGRKVFTYTGAVMTLPTGVQAIAENNYGRPDQALDYLQRMTKTFSFALPGSVYEVSPDYGMMTQAWNLYSYAVPIVSQFFGITPEAKSKTIKISPQLPTAWNEASLENVKVGDNEIDIAISRSAAKMELELRQSAEDWLLVVSFPEGTYSKWMVNGNVVETSIANGVESVEINTPNVQLTLQ